MNNTIRLGDKVKDPLTGLEGIAYSRVSFLQGCDRIGVQLPTIPRKEDTPLVPDLFHVDEPQLVVVKAGVVPAQEKGPAERPGGPSSFGPSGKEK